MLFFMSFFLDKNRLFKKKLQIKVENQNNTQISAFGHVVIGYGIDFFFKLISQSFFLVVSVLFWALICFLNYIDYFFF